MQREFSEDPVVTVILYRGGLWICSLRSIFLGRCDWNLVLKTTYCCWTRVSFVTATRYSSAWMKFYDSHAIQQCVNEILWQPRARAVRGWTFGFSHAIQPCVTDILQQPRDRAVRGWKFVTATRQSSAWMKFCDSHAIQQCVNEILWQPRARAVRGWTLVFSHAIQPCVNDILQQPRDRAVRGWKFVTATRQSSAWMKFYAATR